MKVKILKKLESGSGYWINEHIGEVFEVIDDPGRPETHWKRTDGVIPCFSKNWVNKGVIEIVFELENGMIFLDIRGRTGIFVEVAGVIGALYPNADGVFSTYDTKASVLLETGYYKKIWKARSIYDLTYNGIQAITRRDPVWQFVPKIKELTLQEVADKFQIPVEQLRIKE